jgi:hypothetical protein
LLAGAGALPLKTLAGTSQLMTLSSFLFHSGLGDKVGTEF